MKTLWLGAYLGVLSRSATQPKDGFTWLREAVPVSLLTVSREQDRQREALPHGG